MNKYWKGVAIESIGPLHIKSGKPIQDAHRLKFYKHGFIAVVSDGLGSKKHSDIGANIACKVFIKISKKLFTGKKVRLQKLLKRISLTWVKQLEKRGYQVQDCAATLLGAVYNGKKIFLFRLGDGMITALSDRDNIIFYDNKENSFSNVTKCLSNHGEIQDWQYKCIEPRALKCVFICTDGISDDLKQEHYMDFVNELHNQYKSLSSKEIKKDMDNWISNWPVPLHSDDKTAIYISSNKEVINARK